MLKRIGAEESGEFKAIASGTLPSGKPVVVNADGTVAVVAATGTAATKGSQVTVASVNPTEGLTAVFDSSNNKVVVIYSDNNNSAYGTAIVGTVSGTSISFGSPVVWNSANTQKIGAAFDSNSNKIVAVHSVSSSLRAIVGTVSGTSISFGSYTEFDNGATSNPIKAVFDSTNNKVIVAYGDGNNSQYGTAIVGTVSGTSISFGSATVFESYESKLMEMCFDSTNGKVVVPYKMGGSFEDGKCAIGTVSGTSISFGSGVNFNGSNNVSGGCSAYDPVNQKVVIAFSDRGNGEAATAVVGTVSGTSISFGATVVFESGDGQNAVPRSAVYDSTADKIVISYENESVNNAVMNAFGTVSGTSITFTDTNLEVAASTYPTFNSIVYDSNSDKLVNVYDDYNGGTRITAATVNTTDTLGTNITSENYIGMSKGGAVANTKGATVDIIGAVNDEQSGLTPGQQYFVQKDGTIGTTAATPSVLAGTAISATELLVKT